MSGELEEGLLLGVIEGERFESTKDDRMIGDNYRVLVFYGFLGHGSCQIDSK